MTEPKPPGRVRPFPQTAIRRGRRRRIPSADGHETLAGLGDDELRAAITRRDEAGLAEAVRRHEAAVLGSVRRLVLDGSLAQEVVQEVFLRLWDDPFRFDPSRGSLRTYLLAQAHSRGVDLIRSESARRDRERRATDGATGAAPSALDEHVTGTATALAIRDSVAALPAGERQAIEMAYFGGCTYVEVARRLALPEGTVKSRIRIGLRRLRDDLDARGVRAEDLP